MQWPANDNLPKSNWWIVPLFVAMMIFMLVGVKVWMVLGG